MLIQTSDALRLRVRSLNRGLFNLPTLRHRHFDGIIVAMQQSGTHWLRYMLGLTLAKLFNLPLPFHIGDISIWKGGGKLKKRFSKTSGRGATGFRVVMCLAIQFPPHNRCKHEGKRKMSAKGDEHVRHSSLGSLMPRY